MGRGGITEGAGKSGGGAKLSPPVVALTADKQVGGKGVNGGQSSAINIFTQ